MFEAIYWMFKQQDVKKHFIFFMSLFALNYLAAFIQFKFCFHLTQFLELDTQYVITTIYISLGLMVVFYTIPFLFQCGYFWQLIDCIINRKPDIMASNTYNKNKLKTIFQINLPELSLKTCIWRGIASILATLILILPLTILYCSDIVRNNPVWSSNMFALYLFTALFIPALIWNYAKENSIFSMLNIRKAVYIMGNYTSRYLISIVMILIIYYFALLILKYTNATLPTFTITTDFVQYLIFFFRMSIFYMISLYLMYVYAYLIGNIMPHNDF